MSICLPNISVPLSVCLCLSLYVSFCLYVPVFLTLTECLHVCLPKTQYLCVCLSFCLSVLSNSVTVYMHVFWPSMLLFSIDFLKSALTHLQRCFIEAVFHSPLQSSARVLYFQCLTLLEFSAIQSSLSASLRINFKLIRTYQLVLSIRYLHFMLYYTLHHDLL